MSIVRRPAWKFGRGLDRESDTKRVVSYRVAPGCSAKQRDGRTNTQTERDSKDRVTGA